MTHRNPVTGRFEKAPQAVPAPHEGKHRLRCECGKKFKRKHRAVYQIHWLAEHGRTP